MKQTATNCYHCGEECVEVIHAHDKDFCCSGCKTVYEILEENNLCSYYNLNEAPGVSLKNKTSDKKFAYLDDEQVKQQLIQFSDGKIYSVTFYIPKIHCSSCIFLLENLYKLKEGIS